IFSATGFQIPAAAGFCFPPAVPVFHRRVFVPAAVLPVRWLTGAADFAVAAPTPPVAARHRDAPAPAIAAVAHCAAAGWYYVPAGVPVPAVVPAIAAEIAAAVLQCGLTAPAGRLSATKIRR